ncbi:MAG: DUF2383 domain-containing protein [Aggregatilineales bacterium]
MNIKDVLTTLTRLHALCSASEHAFREAALNAKSISTRILLDMYAGQRAQFVNELENLLMGMGGNIDDNSQVMGAYAKRYQSNTNSLDNLACLTSGEECFLGEYTRALLNNLPSSLFIVIRTQLDEAKRLKLQLDRFDDNEIQLYDSVNGDLTTNNNNYWELQS